MSETASPLSLEVRPDGIAVLTYDVPGAPVNTLRPSFAADLSRAVRQIAADARIKAAILVSGKPDSFIAGDDLEELVSVITVAEAEALSRTGQRIMQQIADCPRPIVAAIHGPALGGGFEAALACHARVLSDDRRTVLGLPEVQLGLLPRRSGLQRLARIVGLKGALDHGLTGKDMHPEQARRLGVAADVVPAPILRDVATALALDLAAAGPPFVGRTKRRARLSLDALTEAALEQNPFGRALLFKTTRKELREKTGGHYPAPERILDVLRTYAERGLAASQEVEARAFGELLLSSTAHRLIELSLATAAVKQDAGIDDGVASPRELSAVRDRVGSYTSRVLAPYLNEAVWLLAEGVTIEAIDRALVAWGFAMGPLALLDEVGIDEAAHRASALMEAFGARMRPPPALERLVADGRKGRKNRRGLYLYGEATAKRGKGRHADPGVYAVLGLPAPDPKARPPVPVEEIQMRCALQLVNEALRCLDEGVLRSPREGDVGAVSGLGFPPFRGGPLRYVDSVGPAEVLRRIEGYRGRFGERWAPAPVLVEAARSGKGIY